MTITKQVLDKRIAELTQKRADIVAQLNAHDGAIQLCQFLLSELDKPEPVEPLQETNQV